MCALVSYLKLGLGPVVDGPALANHLCHTDNMARRPWRVTGLESAHVSNYLTADSRDSLTFPRPAPITAPRRVDG